MVAVDFGRWCLTLAVVNPGHVVTWLFWMALRSVDGTGKKRLAWRNFIKLLVVLDIMAAFA